MKLEISDLPHAVVPFKLSKLRSAQALWVNPDATNWLDGATRREAERSLEERFAYAISATPCFAGLSFDEEDQCTLLAERYGGMGVGENGGGVRVGTGPGFQLKGIGANCLVGADTDASHAYGGLDAPLALSEVVLSHALSKVLPLGLLTPIGLLLTGEETAFDDNRKPCWGVILVREAAVRPAHFLRAGRYHVHPEHVSTLPGDVARTRRTIGDLQVRLAAAGETIEQFIEEFLERCATQFAAARAARVAHSTISPSNIAIDGRWLDVPMASFLPAGRNYSQASTFYGEADVALDCAFALADSYTKYTGQRVDTGSFVALFQRRFHEALGRHTAATFGLPPTSIAEIIDSTQWRLLVDITNWIIHRDPRREPLRPKPSKDEAMACWLEGAFLAVQGDERSASYMRRANPVGNVTPEAVGEALRFVLMHVYERSRGPAPGKEHNMSFGAFVRRTMLLASRRARCPQFFYLGHINNLTNELCRVGRPEQTAPFIDDCRTLVDWVFAWDSGPELVLYRSRSVTVSYDATRERYILDEGDTRTAFPTLSELLEVLSTWEEDPRSIWGFDFRPYLERLAEVVDAPACAVPREGEQTEHDMAQQRVEELTHDQLQQLLDQLPHVEPEPELGAPTFGASIGARVGT